MAYLETASDIVVGQTYLTWGGQLFTVTSVNVDTVHWINQDGDVGATRVRGFMSRVRKPVN